MFPPRSATMARSRRCRRRSSTSIFDHSEITQNAPVSSKASVCSCHVDFQGDILHGLIFFTKIKFWIFFSMRSFLLPLHSLSLMFIIQFPMSRRILLHRRWLQNGLVISKTSTVLEHFGTSYLDIVVLLTRAQIWKTSSIQWKVSDNLAAPSSAFWRVEGSLTILILVLTVSVEEWSQWTYYYMKN